MKKPYHSIPIRECGEKMLPIPSDIFCLGIPHIYEVLGAPYNGATPWMLREGVLASLIAAQKRLSAIKPGWKIKLSDAYRPISVQKFMVDLEMQKQATDMGLDFQNLSEEEHKIVTEKVLHFWAIPSDDPLSPPPHSTGAAFDCTIIDEYGKEIDTGSYIDDFSEKASPDFFANAQDA
ncbi:MAG: D-alanyl-D-alanine dipeptidase, partial [Alphaproteobacteria bacterium]|nr:D-alanyl-D-alanine dipeptidase [Alphaproteobacteria bacterium]